MPKKDLMPAVNGLLDTAAALAKTDPHAGVQAVVRIINDAQDDTWVKNIMEGARKRGFACEYPTDRGISIRVTWVGV